MQIVDEENSASEAVESLQGRECCCRCTSEGSSDEDWTPWKPLQYCNQIFASSSESNDLE
ncbi:hypothetical protein FRX31_023579 [Thalictrum thalictroides]|uniref:Uncharacterized protein n=1 Tax=Thalictrum thalictroides TaxID=46969 RepID=A0A7J6VNZ5_THATH|nr:hypothetical protein FRX31_023579 [Thalictrum thalictroides]